MRGQWWTPVNLPRSERLTIVAGYRDAQTIGRPYVLVEHGAGQSYQGITNGSYSGGEGHDRCVLFLCPSERVAMRWRERYDVPAIACGCPRLDRYHVARRRQELGREANRYPYEGNDQRGTNRPEGVSVSQRSARAGAAVTHGQPGEHSERATGALVTGQSRSDLRSSPPREGDGALVPPPFRPTVAVSFHFDCAICPETRSAWRYYDPHLPRLVRDPRFRVVGHGHPRLWPTIRRRWAELGVEQWPDVDRVLSEADLLVVDNSSVAFETAAIGMPVVLLNLPSYRREVEHGGRFWSAPPGVQVDHPSELADAIACALTDPPAHRAIRARAVDWSYSGLVDGHASERAATAILEALNDRIGMAQDPR